MTELQKEIVGYVGGVMSSISFLPQVIKIWKTKSAKDLSMLTLIFLTCNITLWLTYGILIGSTPLWLTNAIVLSMVVCMIYFKIKFKSTDKL
ncbi:MAG TPA: SemiSWEET family transporter [Ferruginibacter sp.]|nr:SemiSWEET family transporter [Ferruginibacter sp.]